MMVSPIEKKPLFHFYPGSQWLSLGTLGCNFRCPGCQNWEIAHARPVRSTMESSDRVAGSIDMVSARGRSASMERSASGGNGLQNVTSNGARPDQTERQTEYISPERSIQLAKHSQCLGISWTYNEPTIWFEYTLEGARLSKENDLYTNYVTNGYITVQALDMIGPYLDAFRVDLKGLSREFYKKIAHLDDFSGILEVTKRAQEKWQMHIEIVTNIIPGYNDDVAQLRKIASWIRDDLGEDTPWHVTRFVPYLELSHLRPTPITTLEKAREIGYNAGLRYVYLGNVPGHPGENTYCPQCKTLLVERNGFSIVRNRINQSKCPDCATTISGRFES